MFFKFRKSEDPLILEANNIKQEFNQANTIYFIYLLVLSSDINFNKTINEIKVFNFICNHHLLQNTVIENVFGCSQCGSEFLMFHQLKGSLHPKPVPISNNIFT